MLLTSTSDIIRIVTASAVDIDAQAGWADITTSLLTPGRTNTKITTATTTTLIANPGASTQRQVKTLVIRNIHASSSNLVTVQHYDGTTSVTVFSYTLLASESILYTGSEWIVYDANGIPISLTSTSLADGDYGDITVSSSGAVWTIDNNAVTLAKLATQAANTILANATSGAAVPTAVAVAASKFLARSSAGDIAAKDITDFALTILDDTDAATVRATIGAGTGDGTLTSANIVGTITNGVTTNAPSEDAVFDALALKAPLASPTFTGTFTLPIGLTGVIRADTGVVSVDADVTDLVTAGTDTTAGKLELSTDAETVTGTDTARATTPANITAKMAAPGAIGGTTPAAATFTTITPNTSIILQENAPIILDAELSTDDKYSGIVEAGTAGTALAFGDLVYLAAADTRWELADADADATAGPVKLGMCVLVAAGDGSATTILLIGKIRASLFPAMTISAPLYVGTTAGDIQTTAPSGAADIIRVVGHANTADELYFNPSGDWFEHA